MKERVKNIIKNWILRIDEEETLPKEIIALNFGLFEPYGIELTGSELYNFYDDDWACDEDFEPVERTCPDLNIPEDMDWKDVLEMISEILEELVSELDALEILQVPHITTGFCDSDLVIIKG